MQHRAAAGAGLAASDGSSVRGLCGAGSVLDVLPGRIVDAHAGAVALGRLTGAPSLSTGTDELVSVHEPAVRAWRGGTLAVATAGRLTNGNALRHDLLQRGGILAGASDAELVAALVAREDGRTLVNRVVAVLHELRGAFVLAVAAEGKLVVARDPRGFRPLSRGRIDGAWAFASEDTALRDLGGEEIRPVAPGEVVIVDVNGAQAIRPFLPANRLASLADLLSLARDDARVDGTSVAEVRLALGQAAGREHPVPGAEVIVGLPGNGLVAAGFAEAMRRPHRPLLSLAPDAGGDIAPAGVAGARSRLRAAAVRGHEIALVVPVLTTGERVREAAEVLRAAGARRIHLRVASPAVTHVDAYGLALPPPESLAGALHPTPGALADALHVDSAATLSLAGLRDAIPTWEAGWCDSAWSGVYIEAPEVSSDQLDLFGSSDGGHQTADR